MDFDWIVVTPRRTYSRFGDKLALSTLVERLESSLEEIWGFVLFLNGVKVFSWDARTQEAQFFPPLTDQKMNIPEGKPFAYLLRTAGPLVGDRAVLEFGVEPWLKARYEDGQLFLEVKNEQSG